MRNFLEVHETPVGHVGVTELEKIAYRWGYIEARALVQIRFGPFVAKNVLPMIGAERPGIFPLCVSNSIAFANRHPATLTRANGRTLIGVLEPWNNLRRFRPMTGRSLVVVGQCAVKRILFRSEIRRNVTSAVGTIRIVGST